MNDRECAMLQETASRTERAVTLGGTAAWILVWSGGIAMYGLVLAGLYWLQMHPAISAVVGGVLGVGALVCLYAVIVLIESYFRSLRDHRRFINERVPEIQAALNDGRVRVKQVAARRVIEIVEYEDEGSGYIFDVGDGRILFLMGQWVYPEDDDMPWPNSQFEIVRSVAGDVLLGIFCSGHELEPMREIETSDCVDEILWDDHEELLDGDIEQFARSITKSSEPA